MDIQPLAPGQTLPPPLGRADVERVAGSRPNRGQNRPTFMMGHRRGSMGGAPAELPIWYASYTNSGIANLSEDITINGVTVSPSYRYEAKNATTTAWTATVGPDLGVASSGTDILTGRATPLIASADKAVRMMGGEVYQIAANDVVTQIGLEDFVFEWFGTTGGVSAQVSVTTAANASHNTGYVFALDAGGAIYFNMQNGVTTIQLARGGIETMESWVHVLVFCDRNENSTNGFRMFVNGVLVVSGNPSTMAATTLDASKKFTMGWYANLSSAPYNKSSNTSDIAYCAMYKSSGWFAGGATNATQWEAFARERTAYLAGTIPEIPYGNTAPTTQTRSVSGMLDKISSGVRTMYLMGPNWPRVCYRQEAAGGEYLAGLLMEYAATNLFLRSNALSNGTAWAYTNVGIPAAAAAGVAPCQASSNNTSNDARAYDIVASAVNGRHYISQACTLTASTYIASIWAKAGNRNWLAINNATLGVGATFDLANGVVGTTTGACTPKIEAWGNGWYRCWISFTGTAAAHTFEYGAANDTGDTNYAGDAATTSSIFFAPQVELFGTWYAGIAPTSWIYTTSSSRTRNADRLDYTLGNVAALVATSAQVLGKPQTINGGGSGSIVMGLSATLAGSFQTNAASMFIDTTGFEAINWIYSGGVQQAKVIGTTNLYDGEIHAVICNNDTNYAGLKVDGVAEGSDDLSVTMPTLTPAYLQVGCTQGGALYQTTHCLISELKIWGSFQ